jgi:hypothetical protein
MRKLELTAERLLSRCKKDGDCLIWMGTTRGRRYGAVKHNGKMVGVHRTMYELRKGSIPSGNVVMHTCDKSLCINPDHLRVGTQADNVKDMWGKNRQNILHEDKHGMSKLTVAQVNDVRRRFKFYDRKNGARALAKQYGVTHQAISAIVRGKSRVNG